jgi:hypothetical protein
LLLLDKVGIGVLIDTILLLNKMIVQDASGTSLNSGVQVFLSLHKQINDITVTVLILTLRDSRGTSILVSFFGVFEHLVKHKGQKLIVRAE